MASLQSSRSNSTAEETTGGRPVSTGAPIGEDPINPARDVKVNRMGTESIPRLIAEFSIPSIIGMLANGAYNVIDSVFLGQAMGEIGLSAVTAATPVMIIFLAIALLVGNGGNALAALRLGQGDRLGAERALGNTVSLSVVFSLAVALIAFMPPSIETLLTWSGATVETWDAARIFIQILSAGFILQCIGMGVNNFIRTAGAPNRALGTMVIGAVVCIVFNYLFVIVCNLGVVGSACATLVGQAASCVCVLWFFTITKNVPMRLHVRELVFQARTVGTILALGFASFALQAAAAIVSFVLNNMLVKYGAQSAIGSDGALASIGVVQRVALFTVFPLIGVAIAIQPLLGFNYGAHLFARVRTTAKDGILTATAISVFMWVIVHVFPNQIVGAFGIVDADLVSFTVFALKIQLLMLPFIGFQIIGSNYFQATGQPFKSSFLSLSRQVLFLIPLYLVFPEVLPQIAPQLTSLDALYCAVPVADFLSIFTTALFFFVESKRIKRLEAGKAVARF